MATPTQIKTGTNSADNSDVVYHISFAAPRKFKVLKKNSDGTLDIGGEDGKLFAAKVPVSDKPKHGHVTNDLAHLEIKGDDAPEEKFAVIK